MAFIAIKASFALFWNSSLFAPLTHHRASFVSLVTYVADCVLFSFQGAVPPDVTPECLYLAHHLIRFALCIITYLLIRVNIF